MLSYICFNECESLEGDHCVPQSIVTVPLFGGENKILNELLFLGASSNFHHYVLMKLHWDKQLHSLWHHLCTSPTGYSENYYMTKTGPLGEMGTAEGAATTESEPFLLKCCQHALYAFIVCGCVRLFVR